MPSSTSSLLALSLLLAGCAPAASPLPPEPCIPGQCVPKTEFIPVQYALLASGTAPEDVPSDTASREPEFVVSAAIVPGSDATGFRLSDALTAGSAFRWQLQEQHLAAAPIASGGTALAAFRVHSHFDPQHPPRASLCGEELCPEDPSVPIAPWYARPAARIDWSINLSDPDAVFTDDAGAPAHAVPLSIFFNAQDPQAPSFLCGDAACDALANDDSSLTSFSLPARYEVSAADGRMHEITVRFTFQRATP